MVCCAYMNSARNQKNIAEGLTVPERTLYSVSPAGRAATVRLPFYPKHALFSRCTRAGIGKLIRL
jgi:hypothetical protein